MDQDNPTRSRRILLGGMAGGLLASAITPASGAAAAHAIAELAHEEQSAIPTC